MADVGGVPDLAHLAIAHKVDTCSNLAVDAVTDGFENQAIVDGPVDWLASILGQDKVNDVLRPREASDMCREDPSGFSRHRVSSCNW
jgi:hypothetical protein